MAADSAVLPLEPRARMDDVGLVLNGSGLRSFLFFDIYAIGLYLPYRLTDVEAILGKDLPHRVQITLLRDMSTERGVDKLMGGLEDNNTPEELAAIETPLKQFFGVIRSLGQVAKGSVLYLDYLPGVGTRVSFNHRVVGTVPGSDFNRSLLKIWLGERPIQNNLKKALLGGANKAVR